MTKEEILAMEAGEQLNIIIANEFFSQYANDLLEAGFNPSQDISAAMQVLEKLGGAWDIKRRFRPHPDDPPGTGGRATYQARCFLSDYDPVEDELINKHSGQSPWCWQLPEAICKAALLAKLEADNA